jgi:putative ABC transport system substrate-binding protein
MIRRRLLVSLGCAGLGASWVVPAHAAAAVRIGRLSPLSAAADAPNMAAFRRGMRELGWVEGQHFVVEARFGDGKVDRLPALAHELVRADVALIVVGSNPGALAAKKASGRIPIVMVTTGDPVHAGLVRSLAHPGANVTGLTTLGQALTFKRLELLKETVPGISRVAVLANPNGPNTPAFVSERDDVARSLGLQLQMVSVRAAGELDRAFGEMDSAHASAVLVLSDVLFISERQRIVELAARHRMPAVFPEREFVDAGGLLFYGASFADMYARAALYVDRILKGARPAELPVEQPTKLELAVNLRSARVLGLTIPPSVLSRADDVLQ